LALHCHYDQPTFGAPADCAAAPAPATCHGTFDAFSFVVDWQFAKKFDTYAGVMFSQVNGGLASGFLSQQHRSHRWASLPLLRNLQARRATPDMVNPGAIRVEPPSSGCKPIFGSRARAA
jgi:hypothetical protein